MSLSRLDVVIFGASGYTGKYAVYEAVKILENYKWGIAGRSRTKLENTLAEMGKKSGKNLSNIPIIIADVKDENSLLNMAKQTKVIANCCGPYRFFGEQVVKACIEAGTHHVDVSGEPQYMETMELKYHNLAREKGVYIVNSCGYDSIPGDMGIVFLEDKFNGTVNSAEGYFRNYYLNNKSSGPGLNYATWESAINGLIHANELKGIRKKLFTTKTRFSPQLKNRSTIHKSEVAGDRYCLPFPGSDRSCVMRSQQHFFKNDNKRPVQFQAYSAYDSLLTTLNVLFAGTILKLLSKFSFGQKMLLSHPEVFTLGYVSREGANEEKSINTISEVIFHGEGWKEKSQNATDEIILPINKEIITRVTAANPYYGAACVGLLLAATTILNESSKMPGSGGVYAPASAFKHTSFINELEKHGFTFEVVKLKSKL